MEEGKPDLPVQIDEVDALRLESFDKDAKILELSFKELQGRRDTFVQSLVQKYAIDPAKDQLDLPLRAIKRGP